MFRSQKTTMRLLLTAIGLLTLLALACGPADESVQRTIGNSPGTAQDGGAEPDNEPTSEPTVVPTPTLECVYFPKDNGTPTCFVSPTLRPNRYGKISGEANWDAHAAEEPGARSETVNKLLSVKVVRNELVENSKQIIIDWFDEREIEYPDWDTAVWVRVPAIHLGPLSELEAVRFIDTPIEPAPPQNVQP